MDKRLGNFGIVLLRFSLIFIGLVLLTSAAAKLAEAGTSFKDDSGSIESENELVKLSNNDGDLDKDSLEYGGLNRMKSKDGNTAVLSSTDQMYMGDEVSSKGSLRNNKGSDGVTDERLRYKAYEEASGKLPKTMAKKEGWNTDADWSEDFGMEGEYDNPTQEEELLTDHVSNNEFGSDRTRSKLSKDDEMSDGSTMEGSTEGDEVREDDMIGNEEHSAKLGAITAKDDGSSAEEDAGDGDSDLSLDFDVDCGTVKPFPENLFVGQSDASKVYDSSHPMPEGIFKSVGFERYQTVFGIPIIATAGVTEQSLREAAHIFAGTIDNDGNGIPDRTGAGESVREYRTIISYVADAEESENLWKHLYGKPENEEFRNQFACNMHVFEQWAADATPEYHTAMAKRRETVTSDCPEGVDFDWRLWYSPFTWTYYGLQEDFSESETEQINKAMVRAQEAKIFFGNYSEDHEMESADFFVWSLLTSLGALECHCKTEVVESVWKLCTADDLKKFDGEWYAFLENLSGIPKRIPAVTYEGNSLKKSIGSEFMMDVDKEPTAVMQ